MKQSKPATPNQPVTGAPEPSNQKPDRCTRSHSGSRCTLNAGHAGDHFTDKRAAVVSFRSEHSDQRARFEVAKRIAVEFPCSAGEVDYVLELMSDDEERTWRVLKSASDTGVDAGNLARAIVSITDTGSTHPERKDRAT